MDFSESGLRFRFNEEWAVRQYDGHRYYKALSGKGLKGVDFVGIWQNRKVVFFEVKNFLRPARNRRDQTFQVLAQQPELLCHALTRKVEDTFLGIDAIQQYYHRKPSYRLLKPLLIRLHRQRQSEWAFWTRAAQLCRQPEQCTSVFWLEAGTDTAVLKKKLGGMLWEELAYLTTEVWMADRKDNPFASSLRVTLA